MSRKQKIKSRITNLLKFAFAGGLIYWLVRSGRLDLEQLLRIFTPGFLIASVVLTLTNIILNNLRWYWLLRGQGFDLTKMETFRLTFIGLFFNLAVPGGVGGDLIKGYYLVREHPQRRMAAAMTILMDRVLGLVGMIILCIVAIMMNYHFVFDRPDLRPMLLGLGAICVTFLVFFGTALSRSMHKSFQGLWRRLPFGSASFQKLHDVVHDYRRDMPTLIRCIILSAVSQSFTIVFFVMVGWALGMQDVPWQAYLFVVPLGLMILAVPIAPAGVGVGQVAFYILFNKYLGYESQLGTVSISSMQILMILWGLVGAIFYFQRKKTAPLESVLEASV